MALDLRIEYSINAEVTEITVREFTGAYDINNEGGWGSPNPEKNEKALVLYARYFPYNKPVENLSFNEDVVFYSDTIANNEDVFLTLPYTKDGWYKLKVSAIDVDPQNPQANRIYYITALGKLQIFKSGELIDLVEEDWELLHDETIYTFTELSIIPLFKLIQQRNCQLEKYFECMLCTSCKCQVEKETLIKLDFLIRATDYRFHSEKEYEAQRMTETLTKQYKCCK